ncbi:GNAT family N-acetyltransferase [Rheinheimera sp. 4Y26]|uniref:GNAT family N-acetyltransferase n=1 Tax=Rheinheimera sp. 4Y26 TaxID=2977811 RepID=UPI0021B111D8|nr:GNAT family N-acetyltransferase [Rheinheimera sp. 4Y26]MCT6699039.1 GNAT family N-acetyltransferase [Rheinheimera sp. 4Y26]
MLVNVADCDVHIVPLNRLNSSQIFWLESHKKHEVFGALSWFQNITRFEVETKNLQNDNFLMLFVKQGNAAILAVPLFSKNGRISLISNFYTPAQFIFFDSSVLNEETAWSLFIHLLHDNRLQWNRLYLPEMSSSQLETIQSASDKFSGALYFIEHTKNYSVEFDNFQAYWQQRPSIIKNTISRKYKQLKKRAYTVVIKSNIDAKDREDYWAVYANSWKCSEPNCNFINWLMTEHYKNADVYIGFVYIDDIPTAAQLWIFNAGVASIFKLAQDKKFDPLSPGSILTYEMIQHAANNQIRKIDFLLGSDPFKELWMNEKSPIYNVEMFNINTLSGKLLSLLQKLKTFMKLILRKAFRHD